MIYTIPADLFDGLQRLANAESITDDNNYDGDINDYCGGNIDDAYSLGEDEGGMELAYMVLRHVTIVNGQYELNAEYFTTLQEIAKRESITDDPDYELISDYCGGNIDDAYSLGEDEGQIYLAREIVDQVIQQD